MGIATVRGAFRSFEGTLDASGDAAVLEGTVAVDSIDTGKANRDRHLKSPEFFDAGRCPQITFRSTESESVDDGEIRLAGQIAIKGIANPIELTGAIAENGQDRLDYHHAHAMAA